MPDSDFCLACLLSQCHTHLPRQAFIVNCLPGQFKGCSRTQPLILGRAACDSMRSSARGQISVTAKDLDWGRCGAVVDIVISSSSTA